MGRRADDGFELDEEDHKRAMFPTPDWPADNEGYPKLCVYCMSVPGRHCPAINGEGPCEPPDSSAPVAEVVPTTGHGRETTQGPGTGTPL